jgi:hypothetical protein
MNSRKRKKSGLAEKRLASPACLDLLGNFKVRFANDMNKTTRYESFMITNCQASASKHKQAEFSFALE